MVFSGDQMVLCGYVGGGRADITSRSTAEYLAFLVLCGHLAVPKVATAIQEGLAASDDLDELDAKIAERIAADPSAIANNDPEIVDALDAACSAILNSPSGRGLLINPPEGGSGIVAQHEGIESVKFVNSRRRRARVFLDQISYTVAGDPNVEHEAFQAITTLDVSPTTGVTSVVGALSDFIKGAVAYAPVVSEEVSIPVRPNEAIRTKYKATVIGCGISPGVVSQLPPERKQEYTQLALRTVALDLFLPILLNVALPANKEYFEEMLGGAENLEAVTQFLELVANSPELSAAFQPGANVNWTDVVWLLINEVVASDTFKEAAVNMLGALMNKVGLSLGPGNDLKVGFKNLTALLKGTDTMLAAIDASAQIADIARSNQADEIEIIANRSKVLLNPTFQVTGPDIDVDLTATVPDASDSQAVLKYHWYGTGQAGYLHDGIHQGNDFESSKNKVQFRAWGPGIDRVADTITVEAFQFVDNTWTSIGAANAKVEVRASRAGLVPVMVNLRPNESMELVGFVTPGAGQGEVYEFIWNTHGTAGSFNGVLEKVGPKTVTYVAGNSQGSDKVTVKVYLVRGAERIPVGSMSADVLVENEPSYVYSTIVYDAEVSGGVGGWSAWWNIWVQFPDVPGATHYEVQGFDAYWWSYINPGGPPFDDGRAPEGTHRLGLTGGSGWGWGEPPTRGEMLEVAQQSLWRFPGKWSVKVTR